MGILHPFTAIFTEKIIHENLPLCQPFLLDTGENLPFIYTVFTNQSQICMKMPSALLLLRLDIPNNFPVSILNLLTMGTLSFIIIVQSIQMLTFFSACNAQ